MERDPVRFVWRAAPGLNAALIALALGAVPAVWLILELVRTAVDDAAFGDAFRSARAAPFLRIALSLPERLREEPLVFLPGIMLDRADFAQAALGALVAAACGAGLFTAVFNTVRIRVGREAAEALGRRILQAIATAPVSTAVTAQRAASTAAEALTGRRRVLGSAVGSPAISVAMAAAALGYAALTDWRLFVAVAVGLGVSAAAGTLFADLRTRMAGAEAHANEQLRRHVTDLAEHLSALAAHGTAAREQARIAAELAPSERAAIRTERLAVAASGLLLAVALGVPLAVLGLGIRWSVAGLVSPGEAVSGAIASGIGVAAFATFVRWKRAVGRTRPVFADIARQLGTFNARRRDGRGAVPPGSGMLVAEDVVADGTVQGGRLAGIDLSIALPTQVALLGDAASGVRSFAGLLGGQLALRGGRVMLGGTDLLDADPAARAKVLAFAGGETLLLPGTLRDNLLYGVPDADRTEVEAQLADAVAVADLSELIYRRGLAGSIDPRREPDFAGRIVALRPALREALSRDGLLPLVQPFDAARFNPQASLGENILFGVPLGDTFRDDNLPSHAFVRQILDREGLTEPLTALGAAIVRSTLEMFWGLSSRNVIVGRFALLSGPERDAFESILARQGQVRGAAASRDAGRLIGLALRYSESRHRLGLVTPEIEARILAVRRAFAGALPKSLESALEFFHADRVCGATSLLDNCLFGRIALDQADARDGVLGVLNRVLDEVGLRQDVIRTGLGSRIDPEASGFTSAQKAAIDLVRCLLRRPDTLVVQRALDELRPSAALAMAARLQAAMAGRGLLLVMPAQAAGAAGGFDRTLVFEAGRVVFDGKGEPPGRDPFGIGARVAAASQVAV